MAKKNSAKQGNRKDFFDTRSGRVLADLNFADHGTSANLKSQIAFIREAFPLRSKNDITLVLQSCDYNVEAAIACFTNGEADNHLKEWNTQGKKSKNGNSGKKKRNKNKQAKNGEPDSTEALPQESHQKDLLNQNSTEDSSVRTEDDPKRPTPVSSITLECPSLPINLLHPPSPSNSEVSLPSSNSDQPTDATPDAELPAKCAPDSISHTAPTNVKIERMMSTGPDALKKTVKDLQRSSVSLPRFQLLLEEECEKSFKSIAETFNDLRQCLKDREAHLFSQMEDFKKQAVELLEQRQENAAALKLKAERVGGMPEAEVVQLRNEIKNFVTERKIDEELAKTTRFVGDKDQLLSMIKNFGAVVPIKSCYSPVTLNPPPLPTKMVKASSQDVKKTTEPIKPVTLSASASAAVPTVTVPTDEESVLSHKALQEVAELHAKLQAALQQQGLSSSPGKPTESQKQSKTDNKKDRPNSTSQVPSQQQASSQRPQTSLPHNQQRKDHNTQQERQRHIKSAEPRGSQQDKSGNQSYRNSRRANQRRPQPPRNTRPESSTEKKEALKQDAAHSSQTPAKTQQQPKPEKEKQSISEVEKVNPHHSEDNTEHARQGNRNSQAREQRDGGDERPRNRNRRRRGRRGPTEGQNEGHHFENKGEKRENGPHQKGPSQKGPVEKSMSDKGLAENSSLGSEENKATVKEEGDHDIKRNTISESKNNGPVVNHKEKSNGGAKSQGDTVLNGEKETDTGSDLTVCLNGEKTHKEEEEVIKKALPQRQDRASRRKGAQRDPRNGPSSRPAPNKELNGAKPVENGVGHHHSDEESPAQKSENKNVPVLEKETTVEGYSPQEQEKDFDKGLIPNVNGYIPVKEFNEVNIGST